MNGRIQHPYARPAISKPIIYVAAVCGRPISVTGAITRVEQQPTITPTDTTKRFDTYFFRMTGITRRLKI